tara:strand:+ start:1522 stop:1791 length:270 start_codon:yes stop_codon:yes gene_type:complete
MYKQHIDGQEEPNLPTIVWESDSVKIHGFHTYVTLWSDEIYTVYAAEKHLGWKVLIDNDDYEFDHHPDEDELLRLVESTIEDQADRAMD